MCNNATASDFPAVSLAKTVKSVANLTNPYAKAIMNRQESIDEDFVNSIIDQSIFSWQGRNPKPALDRNGNFQTTDLDLLSFMVPMAKRGAVIEIPDYKKRRASKIANTQRYIGDNRFGKITGLISNKDVFSFSVRIFDHSIVTKNPETESESIGDHRNFMLVDVDGNWHNGWDKIVWNPTKKENAFLNEKNLWSSNGICFKYYVHPNRRQSIFGAPYLLLKMLSARLTDEAKFYRQEVKRLQKFGIKFPKGVKTHPASVLCTNTIKSTKVKTMETVLDMPKFEGEYSPVSNDVDGLVEAYVRQKFLTHKLKSAVQFVLRADEAAFFLYGFDNDFVAPWAKTCSWTHGYKVPRGRVEWKRLKFSDSMSLRCRVKTVTQQISK